MITSALFCAWAIASPDVVPFRSKISAEPLFPGWEGVEYAVRNSAGVALPVGPVGPVGPVFPVLPAGPVAPVMPAGPVGPVAPVIPRGPEGPAEPVGPAGPVTPAGPAGPVFPVAPVGPVVPAGPGLPGGPIGPAGPGGPGGQGGGQGGGHFSGQGRLASGSPQFLPLQFPFQNPNIQKFTPIEKSGDCEEVPLFQNMREMQKGSESSGFSVNTDGYSEKTLSDIL